MYFSHEPDFGRAPSFLLPVTKSLAEGVRWFRSVTREDQKEVALAADLGFLGQNEAASARANLEAQREKMVGRSKV